MLSFFVKVAGLTKYSVFWISSCVCGSSNNDYVEPLSSFSKEREKKKKKKSLLFKLYTNDGQV
jgi:hypothetical protein